MTSKLIYTVNETCELLNISRGSLYALINERKLRSIKIGGRRMIASEDLLLYINKLRNAA